MAVRTLTTLPVVDEIERVMTERGLAQRAAAELLDVSPQTLNNWIRGIVTPQLTGENQRAIARFLGVSPRRVVELFDIDLGSDALRG